MRIQKNENEINKIMQKEKIEKQNKNQETLAAVHTHTHTSVLKNRKNIGRNAGKNLYAEDNINKNSDRGESEYKGNNEVYINNKIVPNYNKIASNYNKEANSNCCNSNNYKEENNIKLKKKVIKIRVVFFMALLVVVICCVTSKFAINKFIEIANIEKAKTEEVAENGEKTSAKEEIAGTKIAEETQIEKSSMQSNILKVAAMQNVANEEVGKYGKIETATVTSRQTGTAPWDSNNEPGNDTDAENDIVRSFDTITWNIENDLVLKEAGGEGLTGGIIHVSATLPNEYADLMRWNIDEMKWAEGTGQVSEDGITFTAQYQMSNTDITIPGKQNILLVLKVEGAGNETEIKPEIKMWIEGNIEEEKVSVNNIEVVKVSATGKYNISIQNNIDLQKDLSFEEDGKTIAGRVYGYGVILQLYNTDVNKGLKGLEHPKGDITFDVNLKLTRTKSGQTEDITQTSMPMLYNYKLNYYDGSSGFIQNRQMNFYSHAAHEYHIPGACRTREGNWKRYCYDSGNVMMEQEENKIHVTINNYKFDGKFPTNGVGDSELSGIKYKNNIGCFSTIYFQILVPYTEETEKEEYSYVINVSEENMNITTLSDKNVIEQQLTNDDSTRVNYYRHVIQNITSCPMWIKDAAFRNIGETSNYSLSSYWSRGDAKASIGQKFRDYIAIGTLRDTESEQYIGDINILLKFDGNAFSVSNIDGKVYQIVNTNRTNDMKYQMIYAAKPDGTNWKSDEEMNSAKEENLLFFRTMEDLKSELGNQALCVGVLFESTGGTIEYYSGNEFTVAMQVNENAEIGKVYQFNYTARFYYKNNKLDRTTQTRLNKEAIFPKADVDIHRNYIKAVYNEDGSIKEGTHKGDKVSGDGQYSGQSLLIIGGTVGVKNEITDKNDNGSVKTTFDLARNENEVSYKITPTLTGQQRDEKEMTGITVQITDTLPAGLKYIVGSAKFSGQYSGSSSAEPQVVQNSDGSSKLIWKIYNCTINQALPIIEFRVGINEESANGISYTTTTVISADKIGPTLPEFRTVTNTINVVNLASHRLYELIDTPIIEKDGEIIYNITYKNNTNIALANFQMLNILPYNDDNIGTSYSGTYTLEKVEIKQTVGSSTISNDNLKMYVSTAQGVRSGVTERDDNLGETSLWSSKEINQSIDVQATAIAIKGNVQGQEKIEIKIYLKTNGNKPKDVYANMTTLQVDKTTSSMQTTTAKAEVVKRKITGKVWLDGNKNGIMDADMTSTNTQGSKDRSLRGITVMLQKEDGSSAQDINGDDIQPTITNEQGEYTFENMQRGKYKVAIDIAGIGEDYKYYEITAKEVNTNEAVTSNINPTNGADVSSTVYATDTIDKLDNIDAPEIVASNINAGITYKDTCVKITKIWQGDGTNSATGNVENLQSGNSQAGSLATNLQISRPSEITVELIQNGELAQEITISADESWTKTIEELPCYDVVLQKKIEYTIQEQVPTGYYAAVARTNTAQGNSITKVQSEERQNEGALEERRSSNLLEIRNSNLLENRSSSILENGIETYEYEITNSKYGSITLIKVDSQNKNKTLAGAKFKIEKEGDASFTEETQETTGTGQVSFNNLKYGKYKIAELQAPNGYNLLRQPIEIELTATQPDYAATISNAAQTNLPQTGGMNKLIMMIDGILLLLVMLQYRKSKKIKK